MATFTCITCRVAFMDGDIQRAHYKTDWHRYNLKRKVAEMPPVTAENFAERVMAQRSQVEEQKKDTTSHCSTCNKRFASDNAYTNHINSKKHREAEIEALTKLAKRSNSTTSSRSSSTSAKIHKKNAKNSAMTEAMEAESSTGGATAGSSGEASTSQTTEGAEVVSVDSGDEEMESDADSWEGDGLGEEECLFCSDISEDLEANLSHMTTQHSFFIPDTEYLTDLPGLITYLGMKVGEGHMCLWCNEKGKVFLTIAAVQKHMLDKGHCKMIHEGDALLEYVDFYDYRSSYPDYDGTEAGSGEGKKTADRDDEVVDTDDLSDEGYVLVLPSGASIGHRSLMRYFKQKLRPGQERSITGVKRLMTQYRALGWTGTTGKAAEKKARDIAYVKRLRSKYHMQLGCKANKLQTHFRQQVLF